MKCPSCHKEVEKGSLYCPHCLSEIPWVREFDSVETPVSYTHLSFQQVKRWKSVFFFHSGFLLADLVLYTYNAVLKQRFRTAL